MFLINFFLYFAVFIQFIYTFKNKIKLLVKKDL